MSDAPGENTGDGGQAGGNQPQGGQPQGGQPQGNAPPGGYQTGPSVGDIFSIPETMSVIKTGVATYAILAVGYAIIAAGIGTFGSGGGAGSMGSSAMLTGTFVLIFVMILLTPLLAVVLGYQHSATLDDQPKQYVYGSTAVANALGVLAVFFIAVIFAFAAAPPGANVGDAIGELIVPVLITMIGTAIVGAGTAWAKDRLAPRPPAPKTGAQGQGGAPQNR